MEKYWRLKKEINEIINHVVTCKNPFNVICVLPEESDEIIKKKYKKLSLKVHPDRCKHLHAADAIAFLSKAMKSLENEDERKKYTSIIDQARSELVRELNINGQLQEMNASSPKYHQMLIDRSELVMKQMNERIEKAEKIRKANMQREKEELKHQQAMEQQKKQDEEQWEKMTQQRVNNWKSFMKKKKNQSTDTTDDSKNDVRKPIKPPKATLLN